MKQEDKELSFIDISGRLHYGVIVNYKENEYDHRKWKITNLHTLSYSKSGTLIDTDYDGWISYEEYQGCGMSTGSRPFRLGEVLPYLRPLPSMTEEEAKEIAILHGIKYILSVKVTSDYIDIIVDDGFCNTERRTIWYDEMVSSIKCFDWLNAHHFDYRGLIERGLAIPVTEENNPLKNLVKTQ